VEADLQRVALDAVDELHHDRRTPQAARVEDRLDLELVADAAHPARRRTPLEVDGRPVLADPLAPRRQVRGERGAVRREGAAAAARRRVVPRT
jgi:hypothetical protein